MCSSAVCGMENEGDTRRREPMRRWLRRAAVFTWLIGLAATTADGQVTGVAATRDEPSGAVEHGLERRPPERLRMFHWLRTRRARERPSTLARGDTVHAVIAQPDVTQTIPTQPEIPPDLTLPGAERPGGGTTPTEEITAKLAQEEKTEPAGPNFLQSRLGIEDTPVRIYGWLQNSYTYNANGRGTSGTNFSVFPNRLANAWQGNQYYLILENPIENDDLPNLGFRFDTLFGNDWQLTKDYGLFDRAFKLNAFAGLDFPQIYTELHLPILTPGGVDIKGGRWYTPAGFVAVPPMDRPLLSIPYLDNFTPFTFFGMMSTLHLTDRLNVLNGTINGSDRWIDRSYKWGYIGGLVWNSKDGNDTATFVYAFYPNQLPRFPPADTPIVPNGNPKPPFLAGRLNPFYGSSFRRYFSLTLTHQWNTRLKQALELEEVFDPLILGFAQDGAATSVSYSGLCNWYLYALTNNLTAVFQSEVFFDNQGSATGVATTFYEMTFGFNYHPKPWLYIRPEARYDWTRSHSPFSDGTRSSQFILAIDAIVRF
jgi:hypothetical protein